MSVRDEANEVFALVSAVRRAFVGRSPQVQGAALADLLAIWLSGHVMRGDPKATARLHERVLKQHLKTVRELIEPNYKMTVEPQLQAEHPVMENWVIWSEEHGGWWMEDALGYTPSLLNAGRFTEERARLIEATRYLPDGVINEVAMPDPLPTAKVKLPQ